LRPTLQREMLPHTVESVDEAFQLALDIKLYLQTPSDRKSSFKVEEQPKQQFENNDKPNTTFSKDIKGKTVTGESSQQVTKGLKCFKCHGYGHFAYQCPTRSLLLDEILDDKDHELEGVVHDPTGDFTDAEEDLKEYGTHLNMITCLHAACYIERR